MIPPMTKIHLMTQIILKNNLKEWVNTYTSRCLLASAASIVDLIVYTEEPNFMPEQ